MEFLQKLRDAFSEKWLQLSVNVHEKLRDETPTLLYGLLGATALAPVLVAPNPMVAFGQLSALLGGLGVETLGNLLEEMRTKKQDVARARLLETAARNSDELRQAMDLLLEKMNALTLAREAHAAKHPDEAAQAQFAESLKHSLAAINSRLQAQITVNAGDASAVAVGKKAKALTSSVDLQGAHARDVHINIGNRRKKRRKPSHASDKRSRKQRYLGHIVAAYQHLPVAGFETNLRVPIPLENVYVELKARMAEIERLDRPNGADEAPTAEKTTDRLVGVPQALRFALDRKYNGVVILGDPGSGKTTLAKYLLICFATATASEKLEFAKPLLPILLFLRDIDPKKSISDNILSPLQEHDLDLDEAFFLPYLRDGQAILLLDGLDEVASEAKRKVVSQWIYNQVHLHFPHCSLVVTSRFSGYRGDAVLPGHFLRLEIQDYGLPQVRQFVHNWLQEVETHLLRPDHTAQDKKHAQVQAKIQADDLYRRIESTPALLKLAVNPLMLQIIALVHRDRNTLPDRRVELYKECTDVLLERWDKAKGMDVLLSAREARQLLQPVALWMHSQENRREVSRDELLEYVAPIVPRIKPGIDLDALLQSWVERSGVFKGEGDAYFFYHLSFQEYLTAEEIRNKGELARLVRHFDQAWWREPTLLAVGLTNPSIFPELMQMILRKKHNGGYTDFFLRCVEEALVKEEAPFLQALSKLKRYEALYMALLALERIGSDLAKEGVRQALHHQDAKVVNTARSMLARWGEVAEPEGAEAAETVEILVRGARKRLPQRYYSPHELNAEYILIPGGRYTDSGKQIEVDALYVAKVPVTNQLYRRFIGYLAQDKSQPELIDLLPLKQFADSLLEQVKSIAGFQEYLGNSVAPWSEQLRSRYDAEKRFNAPEQPVVGVSWYAAVAYCQWLSALERHKSDTEQRQFRLPSEQEWYWAASGGTREYPWGDEPPDERRANYDNKVGQTTPVGIYPAGATPEGLLDMAGNVWEWTASAWAKGDTAPVLRGGAFDDSASGLRAARRYGDFPVIHLRNLGFRVVLAPVTLDSEHSGR